MYQSGKSIEEIAETRSMAVSTVEGHLTHFVGTGEMPVSAFVSSEELALLLRKITAQPMASATQLKTDLPDSYSYTKIRAVLAYHAFVKNNG
ncbi:MAG: helix-turn-helix domain-containing protein [Chitinophagaceae bacterium]